MLKQLITTKELCLLFVRYNLDYNAQTIGIILLWLSAALTLFTAYDYMRKGIDHAMSEDSKD